MATRIERLIECVTSLRDEAREELGMYDLVLERIGAGKSKPKRSRAAKPCCTKQEVIAIVSGLLRDNGSLSRAKLEELAKDKIKQELGKNLSMFALRLNVALNDRLFIEYAPCQYRLSQGVEESK